MFQACTHYTYDKIQVNRFEKLLSYRPKVSQMSIGKMFKLVFRPKCARQKDEKTTIEQLNTVKFCIFMIFFFGAKKTTIEIFTLFTGISNNLDLDLNSDIDLAFDLKKK